MNRSSLIGAACAVTLLLPKLGSPWGTLIAPKALTESKIGQLEGLVETFAGPELKAQVRPRLGPHAMHQFIVQQAYKMLERDPAFADGKSGLPTVGEVNSWDGIEHLEMGPVQRASGARPGLSELLCPPTSGGPSPDAELLADHASVNPEYNGSAHYWNPWLQCGQAPNVAGTYYTGLVHRILESATANEKAHMAAYMCHYVADVSSAKHADFIQLTAEDTIKLEKIAEEWAAEPKDPVRTWLTSPKIAEARKIMEDRVRQLNAGLADDFWIRINHEVSKCALKPGFTFKVDVYRPYLETAIAAYLWEFHHRPAVKGRMAFFSYFDPLYFNGPVFKAILSDPSFQLCVALSTHLMWETNPLQFGKTAQEAIAANSSILDGALNSYYSTVKPGPDFISGDDKVADKARTDYIAELVKSCSLLAHGSDITATKDFEDNYDDYLKNSIRHVYLALRSSISGMRVLAKYKATGKPGNYKMRVTVENLCDEAVTLSSFKLLTYVDGKLVSPTGWVFEAPGGAIAKGQKAKFEFEIFDVKVREGEEPILYVEAHGKYATTPDAGVRRDLAGKADNLDIVRNPGDASGVSTTKGPLDLAIVFDTTSSMSGSIEAMKTKAVEIVNALNKQSSDMRLALCSFRDAGADKTPFDLKPFSRDIAGYIGIIGGYTAEGGGDTAEDQLEGIHKVLMLWKDEPSSERIPTKVIVVITDAPAHNPDTFGNTFKTIAKLALEVDPAHIYPVVVGTDASAVKDAQELADGTGGKVSTSADYGAAADKLLEAVTAAVNEHPAPAAAISPETKVLYAGIAGAAGLILGIVCLAAGSKQRKRAKAQTR